MSGIRWVNGVLRSRKAWRRLGLSIVAMIAIGLLVNAVLVYWSGEAVEARLMTIKASGAPIALTDLADKPVRPEENAAVLLRDVQEQMEVLFREVRKVYDDSQDDDRLTVEQTAVVRDAFDRHQAVLENVERASRAPFYDAELDYAKGTSSIIQQAIDKSSSQREPIRLLSLRVLQLVADGKGEAALRTALAMLRLTRRFEMQCDLIVDGLVVIACRHVAIHSMNIVLRSTELSEPLRTELDVELARHDSWDGYVQSLQGERVLGLAHYDETIPWKRYWLSRAYGNWDLAVYLDFMAMAIEGVNKPLNQMERAYPSNWHPMPNLLLRPLEANREAHARSLAMVRCARILNALQRLGKVSDVKIDLSTLGLPTEATVDSYDGQPLRIRQTPEGPVIYSVGKNLKDDGGEGLEVVTDVGLGPLPKGMAEVEKE